MKKKSDVRVANGMREESNLEDKRAVTEERKTQKFFLGGSSFEERELSFYVSNEFE